MADRPVYVLGTGLSHDGGTCLLKDGVILCAIEKERLSRKKHDGGNDALTVQYCLDYAGITVDDLALVVQAANFEKETIQKDRYMGARHFAPDCKVPFVSISHHLAHAYSAIGTCPYSEFNVLIIDGCGSPYTQCDDLLGAYVPKDENVSGYAEKDSFYHYSAAGLQPLYKDFSVLDTTTKAGGNRMPTTRHSIGGLYSMVSQYVFGNMDDAGKLMGLAPYGNRGRYNHPIFRMEEGRVFVADEVFALLNAAATSYDDMKARFAYFADVAAWVQQEVERAILYIARHRQQYHPHPNLCYAGGVALNAVANAHILREAGVQQLYMAPAAADNGLALGCAYYGWLEVLKQKRILHNGSTYLGRKYSSGEVLDYIKQFTADRPELTLKYRMATDVCNIVATMLASDKVVGWCQGQSEFGPRALGNRSILADARRKGVRAYINRDVKFREDFRPFAPALMKEDVSEYFEYGYDSPYMILVDRIKDAYKDVYSEVTHVDGSARVQTVTADSNALFYTLLQRFKAHTGSGVLLNTSLNRKGTPMVETAYEALTLFYESGLDVLVVDDYVFEK